MQRASDPASLKEREEFSLPPHSKKSLRAWLHLLKCSKQVEQAISDLFRSGYGSSLSRFDVLAHLDHAGPAGLSTSSLGQRLLASKGNISRLVDRMEADGLIVRRASATDRRVSQVILTPAGARLFKKMARDHEAWSDEIFGVLTSSELDELVRLLDRVRERVITDSARK